MFLLTTALRSLAQHKGRSLLTIISIIVGIGAVIATLAIGRGAEEKIRRRIASMGRNFLLVYAGNSTRSGATTIKKKKKTKWMTRSDVETFKQTCPEIKAISPVYYVNNKLVMAPQQKIITKIEGVAPAYFGIKSRKLAYGRLFTQQELQEHQNVVVLGSKASSTLFKATPPIGQSVTIKGLPFTVVGVLEKRENARTFSDVNLDIYIPETTCARKILKTDSWMVHGIVLSTYHASQMARIQRIIRRTLRHKHDLMPDDSDDFTIWNQASMAKAAQESSAVFNLFLLIVASLSLLVGGIGVMNIMLVSVTERTREIGVRMALGARPRIVLAQFLIEAVILCGIGGLIGIGVGIAAPVVISRFTGWLVIVSPFSVLLALCITTIIGMIFGYWPARKAAKLNVVEALLDR